MLPVQRPLLVLFPIESLSLFFCKLHNSGEEPNARYTAGRASPTSYLQADEAL